MELPGRAPFRARPPGARGVSSSATPRRCRSSPTRRGSRMPSFRIRRRSNRRRAAACLLVNVGHGHWALRSEPEVVECWPISSATATPESTRTISLRRDFAEGTHHRERQEQEPVRRLSHRSSPGFSRHGWRARDSSLVPRGVERATSGGHVVAFRRAADQLGSNTITRLRQSLQELQGAHVLRDA